MQHGNITYKSLGSDCILRVRGVSPERSAQRLITNYRRRHKPSAAFVVNSNHNYHPNTLIEIDIRFPDQPFVYRSRGLVTFASRCDDPDNPYKIGLIVFGMDRLDPGVLSIPAGSPIPTSEPIQASPPTVGNPAPPGATPTTVLSSEEIAQATNPGAPSSQTEATAPSQETPPAQAVQPEATQPEAAQPEVAQPEAAQPEAAQPEAPPVSEEPATSLKPPPSGEIGELLTGLVGEEVVVEKTESSPMDEDDYSVIGDYVGAEDELLAICIADVRLTNWLGAALSMIPAEAAEKDADEHTISSETRENTQEIFNIAASLFNKPDLPHHRFRTMYEVDEDKIPQDVQGMVDNPVARYDYEVEVPGYGKGRLCYMLACWHPPKEEENSPDESSESQAEQASEPKPEPKSEPKPEPKPEPEPEPEPEDDSPPRPKPPKAKDITELLTGLIGETVGVTKIKNDPMDEDDIATAGDFVSSDDDSLTAMLITDIKLANWLGSALAMIPVATASEDAEAYKMSDECRENVQEIMNIASSVFNKKDAPRQRFNELHLTGDDDLPEALESLVKDPYKRTDFEVDVPGYGKGRLACFIAK